MSSSCFTVLWVPLHVKNKKLDVETKRRGLDYYWKLCRGGRFFNKTFSGFYFKVRWVNPFIQENTLMLKDSRWNWFKNKLPRFNKIRNKRKNLLRNWIRWEVKNKWIMMLKDFRLNCFKNKLTRFKKIRNKRKNLVKKTD